MKAQIYRVASSRFTRSLSILAVAVMAFAALELFFVQPALAGIVCCTSSSQTDCLCDPSLTCSITKNSKFYGFQVSGRTCWNTSITGSASTIKSDLSCASISEEVTVSSTSLTRTGILFCSVLNSSDPPHDGEGRCQIDLSYSRPAGLTQCVNNADNTSTRTWSAFCGDVTAGQAQKRLTVGGSVPGTPATLRCPAALQPGGNLPAFCGNDACILNLGVTGEACNTVFPEDDGLAKGQVLSFSQTVKQSNCPDPSDIVSATDVVSFTELKTRYCNSGLFNGDPVDCVVGTGPSAQTLAGGETSDTSVQFDVTFSPTKLNVTCGPNNNDVWRFTIDGNRSLGNVDRIDTSTLQVGVQGFDGSQGLLPDLRSGEGSVRCGTPVNNTLSCEVSACDPNIPNPLDLGTRVLELRNADQTVDLAVTGFLKAPLDETAIVGVQHVTTTGQ